MSSWKEPWRFVVTSNVSNLSAFAVATTEGTAVGPNGLSASTNGQQATAPVRFLGTDLHTSSGGTGLILKSPNQTTCRRPQIDDAGNLLVSPVSCP